MDPTENTPPESGYEDPLSLDEVLPTSVADELGQTQSVSQTDHSSDVEIPVDTTRFGRYRVTKLIGRGGYGSVFKAFDQNLQRHVAIKVPLRYRLSSESARQRYIEEGRTLARLEHHGVVNVYDVGVSDDGLPYIVSAFIDGSDLATRMQSKPFSLRRGLKLIIEVAKALGYVHAQGIVHRDIKPGNILLSSEGKPFIADFGLALRDELAETNRSSVGTPTYMSPEQARGESHLVDGRSDLFSLGILLYEMLTGRRPFHGRDRESLIFKLIHQEPRPPRQLSAKIPADLERICMKLLAKQASQRYSSAQDLVDDLEHLLQELEQGSNKQAGAPNTGQTSGLPTAVGSQSEGNSLSLDASAEVERVVPRGLRSYDRHDANFFCRLLPGPRDREGVPESVRFWQRQINSAENIDPPRVGILYGPSGCGKSSFVKAGLVPLLDENVTTVFVEATRDETESRLLRGIMRRVGDDLATESLSETLTQIRVQFRNQTGSKRKKLLIVIDQFEQWLHGRADQVIPELATALRQCDGTSIQCLLLVRDDFWLALSRFMAMVDVPLQQNHNTALVDLFSEHHAKKVLQELGVAYERLPPKASKITPGQQAFIDRSVSELSEDGKIFPVRLSLFVEMLKNKPWEIETLNQLGGVHGIGLQFLEESFSSELAPVAQRTHEPAVRNVLRKLLPEQGVNIKGNMQSEQVLLDASGYASQPELFDSMMRILESDLRLVTPTDPSGTTTSDDSYSQSGDGIRYYQLTHDYLVPAIEQWLTRRQRETRQGRAELRLADYASLWASKPVAKYAPSWFDWISIRFSTSPDRWNSTERKMMAVASRRHLLRTLTVICCVLLLVVGAWLYRSRSHANGLVQQLQTARIDQIGGILSALKTESVFAEGVIRSELDSSLPGSVAETANRLALMPLDASQRNRLNQQSLSADMPLLMLLRSELQPHPDDAKTFFLSTIESKDTSDAERLRASIMLADPTNGPENDLPAFRSFAPELVAEMIRLCAISPNDHALIVDGLTPVSQHLIPDLRKLASAPTESFARNVATGILVQFTRETPEQLLDFFLGASHTQLDAILPAIDEVSDQIMATVRQTAFADLDEKLPEPQFDAAARRKGTAAALLHRVGESGSTWPMLQSTPRPNARGYIVDRVPRIADSFAETVNRFSREPNPGIRRGLLLIMGFFPEQKTSQSVQVQAVAIAKDAFLNDPDAGIHSMAYWLLRRWGEQAWLSKSVAEQSQLPRDPRKNWYINGEGQTMAILDARHVPEIGRVFAISTGEVTVQQFQRAVPKHPYNEDRSPEPDYPMGMLNWFDCIDYCRWLNKSFKLDPKDSYPQDLTPENPEVSCDHVLAKGAYRLPTAEEWSYACKALTVSPRYYGSSDDLADHYYWYYETSLTDERQIRYSPAGSMPPNDFGMFSMYDNVREWGQTRRGERRSILGSSSSQEIWTAGSLDREFAADLPMATNGYYGLRVARTVVEE